MSFNFRLFSHNYVAERKDLIFARILAVELFFLIAEFVPLRTFNAILIPFLGCYIIIATVINRIKKTTTHVCCRILRANTHTNSIQLIG